MGESSTDKWFREASASWEEGRIKEAFRLFLAAAKAGDPSSQLNVGFFYDTGLGVKKSRPQAMYWYRRAWRRGETIAATNIAIVYRDEGRLRLALRWFEKAVALGDDDAMLDMARLYAGSLANPTKARRLLRKVLASKNVTEESQEQAARLLEQLR
jgi:hypothetical protein